MSANGPSITVTGANLDTVTGLYFSEIHVSSGAWSCSTPTRCTLEAPRQLAANTTYTIYLLNPAGLSVASPGDTYTTEP